MSTTPKVWFITGTSKGFGRIWAEAASKRGDKVVATACNPGSLDDLVARYGSSVFGDVRRTRGNPQATGPAILEVVDADGPPLRIFFGAGPLEMIKDEYAKRIANWEKWNDLSVGAHGKPEKTT